MNFEVTKKEKALAIITVFFLFIFVGLFSFSTSVINKKRTESLKKLVLQQKAEKIAVSDLNKIYFDDLSLTNIKSKSYISLIVTNGGTQKILAEKNSNMVLPIASITKLMVAIIVYENINLDTNVTATLDYIGKEESAFVLETNKVYEVKELLINALISSDNDSARLISSVLGENNFLAKMNLKAQELNLTNTKYINVTGLDPKTPSNGLNHSTVNDLVKLILYIKNKHPEILALTTKSEYNFCDIKKYCKIINSTNKLLEDKEFKYQIIGGKTGTTDTALKNLALIIKPLENISLINIVLGAEDNFSDTLSLISHIKIKN